MRVAVIGARRSRTGTGAYLARFLVQEGADVVALYGTTPRTAQEATDALEVDTGIRAKPVWDSEALMDTYPEALIIASPDETHAVWIRFALRHSYHVLCEKPLVWGATRPAEHAPVLIERAERGGLVLRVATQWPFTLPTYEDLFPGVAAKATSFFMRLSPTTPGRAMFRTSLSHPLSLLAAVVPDMDARVLDPEVELAETQDEGRIHFAYEGAGRRLDCTVHLVQEAAAPRTAAYGFDDAVAHRVIDPSDYSMALEAEGRRVPMPDPMRLLVRSFLADVAMDPPRLVDPAVATGMRHLVALMAAVPGEETPSP
ncbi:MAG: Gfo/Idh/MocA family oxidoreductase [Planctomycetota bacterium]|nr:Gfo/Idh/MocA family oxidoreductase [Planctomycetota bacterium]